MLNTPPITITDSLNTILTRRGLTPDWLNTDNGDPYSPNNLARYNLAQAEQYIPLHYRNAVPDLPELANWATELADTARAKQQNRPTATILNGRSILLLGPTGVGKTHQAYGAIRDVAVLGCSAQWKVTTSADMYAALRPRHNIDSEAEFRTYRDARLLLIDDLGAAKASEFTEETNFRLINWRYERQLPTLMTSNVLPKQLTERLGDRVASRLVEMCDRVVITGTDRRRAA
jgi:DNA replication protein DnaC